MKCSELFFMKGKETFPEGLKSGWVGVEVGVGGMLDGSKIWSGEDRGTSVKFQFDWSIFFF